VRTVFVLFDSLNRLALGPYGSGNTRTPNFDRLAARSVTFDSHYAGSLPCIPARRDLMSGRLNFLHRSWGPLEPFDHAFPALLRNAGVYSHLVTDHYHYFEEGGGGYHQRFDSWVFERGQEADPWHALVRPPITRFRERYHRSLVDGETRAGHRLQNLVNREAITAEADFPLTRTFDGALAFLETNRGADDWFLQVEAFDPHEPFCAPARFRSHLPTTYTGRVLDWPRYRPVSETPEEIAELQANYAALLAFCDEQLGRLLDFFDRHRLWEDTVLVVSTDHGFLLDAHGYWGKNIMPLFDDIVRLPLFIHHPDHAGQEGTRRRALTQAIDLMPTFLDIHGVRAPPEVLGRSLLSLLGEDGKGHDAIIFGIFGGAINITDGRCTYFHYPADWRLPIFEYTLLPLHPRTPFSQDELRGAAMTGPSRFSNGWPVLKIRAADDAARPPMQGGGFVATNSVLYRLEDDPGQSSPVYDPTETARLMKAIAQLMSDNDAPTELFERMGLSRPA
jgi:arylsulfatase A-like enzyme